MKKINEEFICLRCGFKNIKAQKTCRNHCAKCLYSLHLDDKEPGDRKSKCENLMEPIEIDQNSKKGIIIVHKCISCGKIQRNKVADDDNMEKIIEISTYSHARNCKK